MLQFSNLQEFPNMSNAEYHSHGLEVISSSFVKGVAKHSVGKAMQPSGYNNAFAFGSAFHDYMQFGKLPEWYAVSPDIDKRTKEYKSWVSDNSDKTIITDSEYNDLVQMYANVQSNDFYKNMITHYETLHEYSYFADCDNLRFRVRPDVHWRDNTSVITAIGDYKTCQDVTQFKYDIKKYGYDIQAVFYSDILGINPVQFYFIAVEKTAPYTVQVFSLSESTIEYARSKMLRAIERIKDWKVYGEDKPDFDLIEVV